jgi:pilus retraction protein PilT
VFHDRSGIGAVMRLVASEPPNADELGLPDAVRDMCSISKGLVVVTGPTGSGKSTTLAAMIDLINRTRAIHIITIEDPVEFIHPVRRALVNQREVHSHTRSFATAVRAAMREDPDIILVGEMRDLETIEAAVEAAETGHLVFGTLHTNTAAGTVERIVDKFPSDRQNQIRSMLADSLKGVIAQVLCKKIGGGRAAAMEILLTNAAISNNIREGKTHQIASSMQTGRKQGMRLFNDSFMELVAAGVVAPEEAYAKAADKDDLVRRFAAAGIKFDLVRETRQVASEPKAAAVLDSASLLERQEVLNNCLSALGKDPDNLDLLNNIAWMLATSESPDLRNSEEALRMARRAYDLTKGNHAGVLDTLGAAYAENGHFDKAVESSRSGLQLALAGGDVELAHALESRITLYQSGSPLRE